MIFVPQPLNISQFHLKSKISIEKIIKIKLYKKLSHLTKKCFNSHMKKKMRKIRKNIVSICFQTFENARKRKNVLTGCLTKSTHKKKPLHFFSLQKCLKTVHNHQHMHQHKQTSNIIQCLYHYFLLIYYIFHTFFNFRKFLK